MGKKSIQGFFHAACMNAECPESESMQDIFAIYIALYILSYENSHISKPFAVWLFLLSYRKNHLFPFHHPAGAEHLSS